MFSSVQFSSVSVQFSMSMSSGICLGKDFYLLTIVCILLVVVKWLAVTLLLLFCFRWFLTFLCCAIVTNFHIFYFFYFTFFSDLILFFRVSVVDIFYFFLLWHRELKYFDNCSSFSIS